MINIKKPKEKLSSQLFLIVLVIIIMLSYSFIITNIYNELVTLLNLNLPNLTMGLTYLILLFFSTIKFCLTPVNTIKDLVENSDKLLIDDKLKYYTMQLMTIWFLYAYYNVIYYFVA